MGRALRTNVLRSEAKLAPHITLGAAPIDCLKGLKAKPFARFTFNAANVAICQLENFGRAHGMSFHELTGLDAKVQRRLRPKKIHV